MHSILVGLTDGDITRTAEEALAILAIVLAFWHGVKLRQQLESVNRLAQSLQSVETQLTTEVGRSVHEIRDALPTLRAVEDQLREQVGRGVQEIRDALPTLRAVELQLSQQIGHSVQEIREALPTKQLGRFPTFLPAIVEKLCTASRSITIFCDFPAYGSFSDPKTFRRYHRAIEDKIAEKKRVTIACLGEHERADVFREQEQKQPDKWKAYKELRYAVFQKYLDFHAHKENVDELTNERFIDYIIEEDNEAIRQHYRGAHVLDVTRRPTVYFWLIDDNTMIFVIPSATRLVEYGFYTQDSHLIASLKEIALAFLPSLSNRDLDLSGFGPGLFLNDPLSTERLDLV